MVSQRHSTFQSTIGNSCDKRKVHGLVVTSKYLGGKYVLFLQNGEQATSTRSNPIIFEVSQVHETGKREYNFWRVNSNIPHEPSCARAFPVLQLFYLRHSARITGLPGHLLVGGLTFLARKRIESYCLKNPIQNFIKDHV